MKKEVKKIIPAQPETTKNIIEEYCDLCGVKTNVINCILCNREVCYGASYDSTVCSRIVEEKDDETSYYCIICYRLKFNIYDKGFVRIEKEAEKKKKYLLLKIKKESLNTKL